MAGAVFGGSLISLGIQTIRFGRIDSPRDYFVPEALARATPGRVGLGDYIQGILLLALGIGLIVGLIWYERRAHEDEY